MRRWVCPKCGERVECIAREVGHRCRHNKNRWTKFEEDDSE